MAKGLFIVHKMRHPERIAKEAVFSFVTRLIYGPESIRPELIRPVLVEM